MNKPNKYKTNKYKINKYKINKNKYLLIILKRVIDITIKIMN